MLRGWEVEQGRMENAKHKMQNRDTGRAGVASSMNRREPNKPNEPNKPHEPNKPNRSINNVSTADHYGGEQTMNEKRFIGRLGKQICKLLFVVLLLLPLLAAGGEDAVPKGVLPTPSPPGAILRIVTDKAIYSPGEAIAITIETDREGFLYLYEINPEGTVTLLFPNRFQPDPLVPGGILHLPGEGYRFIIGLPEGVSTLVAIFSSHPLPGLAPTEEAPFRRFTVSPAAFARALTQELEEKRWSSAWTQITIHQPLATVYIGSQPAAARILVDGDHHGYTPKEIILPAGKVTITLEKDGYERFTRTVILHDREVFDFEARLQQAVHPLPAAAISPAFLAVDLGIDSVGVELGIARIIGLTASLRFTGEAPPAAGGVHNLGPELGFGLRLHVPLAEGAFAFIGAGIALQNRTTAPPTRGLAPLSIIIEPIITTALFPSFTIGIATELRHATLSAGYHLRRGFLVGIGLSF